MLGERSVDKLQKQLQQEVFHYAKDAKKAAGRALGTLVEIITYYKICSWGFARNTLIEKRIPEFGRPDITHNVEFSIHKMRRETKVSLPRDGRTITARAIGVAAKINEAKLEGSLLDSKSILRNSAVLGERDGHLIVANLRDFDDKTITISLADLNPIPRAIFECKRVGVEEGMKKGPQSIEKAKQGAYVARSVSALQKVISEDGMVYGFLPRKNQKPVVEGYDKMLSDIVAGEGEIPTGFVLTVGVTSNHGNWFTAEDHNKELKVLAAAYDWLLFLTDEGLMEFVEDTIIKPNTDRLPIKQAFLESYSGKKGVNRFTKTKLDLAADTALRFYFEQNQKVSDEWFNVITPNATLCVLSEQLDKLLRK